MGLSSHQRNGGHDEWLTPPEILRELGPFDLDPCSPITRPWRTADQHYSRVEDGLAQPWAGRVWLNPPFGREAVKWLRRLIEHGNGIALVPDRTSAPWFQQFAPRADALLFVSPKLKFIDADGNPGTSPAQGTCLMALGEAGTFALREGRARGLGMLTVPA